METAVAYVQLALCIEPGDGGPLFPSSTEDETSDQWSADAWVRGAGVHRIIAAALQRAAAQQGLGDGPQAVLGFLRATKDRATLSEALCTCTLLNAVVELLWRETQKESSRRRCQAGHRSGRWKPCPARAMSGRVFPYTLV